MWLLAVFRYRASVRLSKISKVEIYTPQMKFLATPLILRAEFDDFQTQFRARPVAVDACR